MTNDLDRDLRELFLRHEADMTHRGLTPPPKIVRRTRSRQARTLFIASLAAIAVAVAGIAGLDAIRASEGRPANTGPTGPTGPAPSIDWTNVPSASVEGDAIVDIRTGEVTALPASITALRAPGGYAVAPGGGVLLFEARTGGESNRTCSSDPHPKCQIFIANVDGTNLRQLTDASLGAWEGSWSPDGRTIVANVGDGLAPEPVDLALIDVATGETTLLSGGSENFPHFDADGQRILVSRFQKYRDLEGDYPSEDEGSDVYGIPIEGGEATLVFEDRWNATFSPGASTIVYEKWIAVGRLGGTQVWLADADGSDPRPLVDGEPFSWRATWSPDGTRIAAFMTGALVGVVMTGAHVGVVDVASGTPTFSITGPRLWSATWLDDHTLLVDTFGTGSR